MSRFLEMARGDFKRFTDDGFSVELTFSPDSVTPGTSIMGLSSRHHQEFDLKTGAPINSINTHCSFSEVKLNDLGYITRNSRDEVDLIDHLVSFKDAKEVLKTYTIIENKPSETLGYIVLTLGYYESD